MDRRTCTDSKIVRLAELGAACYQTRLSYLDLCKEIDGSDRSLEDAWVLVRVQGSNAGTQPGRYEVPTSSLRTPLRHMYMRLVCGKPKHQACPTRFVRKLPLANAPYTPPDAPRPSARAGTRVLTLRCSVGEGTQGLLWRVVVAFVRRACITMSPSGRKSQLSSP